MPGSGYAAGSSSTRTGLGWRQRSPGRQEINQLITQVIRGRI
jgi:hypothetical protein